MPRSKKEGAESAGWFRYLAKPIPPPPNPPLATPIEPTHAQIVARCAEAATVRAIVAARSGPPGNQSVPQAPPPLASTASTSAGQAPPPRITGITSTIPGGQVGEPLKDEKAELYYLAEKRAAEIVHRKAEGRAEWRRAHPDMVQSDASTSESYGQETVPPIDVEKQRRNKARSTFVKQKDGSFKCRGCDYSTNSDRTRIWASHYKTKHEDPAKALIKAKGDGTLEQHLKELANREKARAKKADQRKKAQDKKKEDERDK